MPGYGQSPYLGTLPWGPDQVAQPAVQPGPGSYRIPLYSPAGLTPIEREDLTTQRGLSGDITYITPNGITVWGGSGNAYAGPLTVVPTAVGDLLVATVANQGATSVASLSGGGVTTWTRVGLPWTDSEATPTILEVWMGTVTTAGSSTVSITWNAAPGAHFCELNVQQFHASTSGGTWVGEQLTNRTNASASSVTWPQPTPTQPACIYVGYASTPSTISWSNPAPANQQFATENGTPGNNSYVWATAYSGTVAPTLTVSISSTSFCLAALFYYTTTAPVSVTLADQAAAVDAVLTTAWTLVQQSAAPSTISSAGTVSPTLPAPSTAGNLVLFKVLTGGSAAAPTAVTAGFTARANSQQASAPVSRCDVFDYINNPGGITTASATLGNGGSGFLEEWTLVSGPPGTAVLPDVTGSAVNASPVTPFTVATSSPTTAAQEMAAVAYVQRFSAATVATLAAGPGFTQAGQANNGSSTITHFGFDYRATTGPSGVTPSDATTTTSTGAGSQNGLIVTYAATIPITLAEQAAAVESLSVSVSVPVADAAGAADRVILKMDALTDNFPGTSVDATKWTAYGTTSVASSTLTLPDTANSTAYSGISSINYYDLTSSYFLAHITNGGSQFASTQAMIVASRDASNTVAVILNNGNLQAQHQVAGSYATLASIAWSGATMSWLRLRETGGTLFYEYSADGITWSTLWSESDPFTLTSMQATVQEGAFATTDPAATSTWQSVNLPPTGATPALADAAGAADALAVTAAVPLADRAAGADAITVPAETIPLAEVAGAADAVAVPARTIPLAEVAGAAEQLAVSATVPVADTGAAAESVSVSASVPIAEVGGAAETVAVAATVPLADQAAGSEALTYLVGVSPADTAGAGEALTATATVPLSDAAAGVESLAVSASLAAVDTAAAADQLSVSAATSLAESGAGAEASVATATVPLADVAGAFEASPRMLTELAGAADTLSAAMAISYADVAAGAEALVVTATAPLADVAGGQELLTVTAAASLADAAGAVEQATASAAVPVADAGAGTDAQLVGIPTADAAAAAEALSLAATVPAADAAAGADAVSVTQGTQVNLADVAGAREALAASVASPATEAGGAADVVTAAAALVFGDQAGAADAISVVAGANPQLADAAAAADSTAVVASVSTAEVAGSVESAAATVTVPLPERAGAAEASTVSAILPLPDAGSAAEALATVQTASPVLGDAAGGTEALSASVTTAGQDVAAAAESLVVAQSRSLADQAAAAESLIYVIPPTGPQPVWEVGPAALRWHAVATGPAWQVAAAGPRWEAVATPPRWDVSAAPVRWRVIMAVFEPVASLSAENVNATWTSDLGGTEVDPTAAPGMGVKFAFPVSSGDELNPAQPASWFGGTWLAPTAGRYKGFIAQCIIGPTALGGLVQLARGAKYDVWSEVDTGSETVRKFVGVLPVY
jgi:hypothetical protein